MLKQCVSSSIQWRFLALPAEEKQADVMQATIKTVEEQKASITGETDLHL